MNRVVTAAPSASTSAREKLAGAWPRLARGRAGSSLAQTPRVRRGAELGLTVGVGVTVLAALLPLLRVISPGWWALGTLTVVALVLAAGYLARRFAAPAVAVTLVEAAVWLVLLTILFGRSTALLGVIPTPDTFRSVPLLLDSAVQELALGAAPLDAGVPLAFLLISAVGLLAMLIDHVVLSARLPLVAAVGLIAVSLIPAMAVPSDVDVTSFVLLAAGVLFLLRAETRTRESRRLATTATPSGVSAVASGIGAIAVVVAVSATPLLPVAEAQPGAGLGFDSPGNSIDASLELGSDLRQPRDSEVLRLRTDAFTTPYLRVATVSQFTGRRWIPDATAVTPLSDDLDEVIVAENVRVTEYTTSVEIIDLTSQWLPVAYPAVEVTGLDGEWSAMRENRTVVSEDFSSNRQTYDVVTHVPRPTLEQIRAADARLGAAPDETTSVPDRVPGIVGDLAREVTAGTTTDYDALVALQRWFRGGEFEYSLEAPVEEGFDGSGLQAMEKFLQVRSGYCVHFAASFALMARILDMPSRVVVGYLPGTSTGESIDGQTVYSVMSSQLHAWPEVYFEGIGWVPFEATPGRGVPTTFAPASVPLAPDGTDVDPNPTDDSSPAPSPSIVPGQPGGPPLTGSSGSEGTAVNPLPGLAAGLSIALLLAIPALLREARRRTRISAARAGDASAAWRELQDTALDLGIPVPASETPRALGARLVSGYRAPHDAVAELVQSIERASYARGGQRQFGRGPQLADAVLAARAAMLAGANGRHRMVAVAAPRSLVIRPGSVYAGGAVPAPSST
ncbi:transglutaminaseTgpA domain-containing protein [Microbacterium sp. DT81.1]|uniref:transglutaminase TgpA family protein n=1 Tax=Microbacterium sp. DT81.1 TaxID=3393413 RepID=UPI003CED0824